MLKNNLSTDLLQNFIIKRLKTFHLTIVIIIIIGIILPHTIGSIMTFPNERCIWYIGFILSSTVTQICTTELWFAWKSKVQFCYIELEKWIIDVHTQRCSIFSSYSQMSDEDEQLNLHSISQRSYCITEFSMNSKIKNKHSIPMFSSSEN